MSARCPMIGMLVLLAIAAMAGGPARAQPQGAEQPPAQAEPVAPADEEAARANAAAQARTPERIDIGLSKEVVEITSDFAGEALIIFGAIDNADTRVQRQGHYDIFVVLEGPRADLVTRRKARVFGIWMNVESQTFETAPQSYLIASTRFARDIAAGETLSRLALNVDDVRLRPSAAEPHVHDVDMFVSALRRLKRRAGLYQEFPGGVQFISQSLFRAELRLPANVPLGTHRAQAYLFRNGVLVAQTGAPVRIAKAGFEFAVSDFARNQPLYYGLAAVLLALIVGWLGRILFRRD
ncbi:MULTISPECIES: TIGR02186 family protein [unclassified Roseitalea]|uniref:TIGR02186 family protein n=1 Tax=unclassified Roseitalea TaxID=2639107 RepID=UPI00273E136A|nr:MULTISPECIES: TIGR02186 family protein [unclassified Roseitalea]